MRNLLLIFMIGICGVSVTAQQDLQSSTYFLSPLAFNPAYAGSRGSLNVHAVNRVQWLGWDGAPRSQIFSVNAPVFRRRVGVGLSLATDQSGARSASTGLFHAAYHMRVNDDGLRLSLGLSAGTVSNGYDFSSLRAQDPSDTFYADAYLDRSANFGAGAYVWDDVWYAGISVPHLMHQPLAGDDPNSPDLLRHVYLSGGYALDRGPVVTYRFSGVYKKAPNAPASLDLNMTAWAYDLVGIGALLRLREGVGVHATYRLSQELQLVYAIDFPLNHLRVGNGGTHEIALLFDLSKRRAAYESPRYF